MLALTVQEMRQEQSPQAGGELLTGIDEPSYLGTVCCCLLVFLPFQAEYLLFASTFWFLETSIEKGACSSYHRLTSQATWMEQKSGEGWKMAWSTCSRNFMCLTHSEADNLKQRHLEQRRFIARPCKEAKWLMPLKSLELTERFWHFKSTQGWGSQGT